MKRASNNNIAKTYGSYQQGGVGGGGVTGGGSYQPPVHYAKDQTKSLEDTTKTFYQTDETATRVLNQMTAQRQQIGGEFTKEKNLEKRNVVVIDFSYGRGDIDLTAA